METLHKTGKDLKISFNDLTVSYDDMGAGEIPVIFIHGFPFNKSTWQNQMELLKNTNRVIAYDIRSYGKSTAGSEPQGINLFADDLIRFMDALQISKAIVCGFSMGGYTLLNAASRYSERFEALIFCDTQCIADSPEAKEKRTKTIEEVKSGKIVSFTEGFLKAVFCPASLESKPGQVDIARKIIHSTSLVTIAGGLSALSERSETCSTLNKISVPVLILCGKEDAVTPATQSEFLHSHIKNSELHIIEKAGHMSNLEQPEEFNKYLGDFIQSVNG